MGPMKLDDDKNHPLHAFTIIQIQSSLFTCYLFIFFFFAFGMNRERKNIFAVENNSNFINNALFTNHQCHRILAQTDCPLVIYR